jgi:dienelactone hydrolase
VCSRRLSRPIFSGRIDRSGLFGAGPRVQTCAMKGFPSRHYVTFRSLHEAPLTVAARLMVPAADAPAPAVILLHGSAGPSSREAGYAKALHAAGFATLEPDQWSCRGLAGGSQGRPATVAETLPDLYGARAFLASRPGIDPARIGVAGFSFGGVATMLAATRAANDRFLPGGRFAALMAVYPACWTYNVVPGHEFSELADAPLLLATGALDQYDDDPDAGPKLAAGLAAADRAKIRTHVFAGAHHCFDMPGVDEVVQDPMSHRGRGGSVVMRHNPQAAAEAHALCVAFFSRSMR